MLLFLAWLYGLLELGKGRARAIYRAAMLYSWRFVSLPLSVSTSSSTSLTCCCFCHRLRCAAFGHFRGKCCCFRFFFTPFWAFSASSININILKGNLAKSSTGLPSFGSFPVPPLPHCAFLAVVVAAFCQLEYDYLLHNNKREMNQKTSEGKRC